MSVSVIFYHIDLKVESLLVSFIYLFGINKQYLSEYRLSIFVFIHNHCFSFEKNVFNSNSICTSRLLQPLNIIWVLYKYLWANKNNGNINILLSILPWTLRIKSWHQRTYYTCFNAQAHNWKVAWELKYLIGAHPKPWGVERDASARENGEVWSTESWLRNGNGERWWEEEDE